MNWYQQFIVDGKPTTPKGFMNQEYFESISKLLPKDLKGKVVLDLACNAGFVSFELAKLGAKVIGFDNNEDYIDQAHYIMSKTDVPKVKFLLMDIEELEPSFYKPNLIMLLSCLYHLKEPKKFVKKLNDLDCDLIVSFRNNNYDHYIKMFDKQVVEETSYGRKRAALLR